MLAKNPKDKDADVNIVSISGSVMILPLGRVCVAVFQHQRGQGRQYPELVANIDSFAAYFAECGCVAFQPPVLVDLV
jgi:hypothetical protein